MYRIDQQVFNDNFLSGKSYEMKKEELGYKKEVLVVRRFGQYS